MRRITATVALALLLLAGQAGAWSNSGKSTSLTSPKFGTHDYIAYKGLRLAGTGHQWLYNNLTIYFIGTEAPDFGTKPAGAGGGYSDTGSCHCILFDSNGDVTKDRLETRVREEFDKAKAAYGSGDMNLAAFYAGAMAHYMGDLAQFCHIMGPESHWGSEDKKLHSGYEQAVEKTMTFTDKSSSLLDSFMTTRTVGGTTPETIARAAAKYTEDGTSGRDPAWMHARYKELRQQKKSAVAKWDADFRNQTGQNIKYATNGIAKLIKMIEE